MKQEPDEQELIKRELDNILDQLPWGQLNKAIIHFRDLKKAVTAGGGRILAKNRKIIIPVLKRKCLENQEMLHYLFASWFNEQEDYYACLAPFFESEEHERLLTARGKDDCAYVINDAYFAQFIDLVRPGDIDKFLLLSPVCFTSAQKEQLEQLRHRQDETEKAAHQVPGSEAKKTKQTDDVFVSKGEWKYHKKELKKYQEVIEKLEKENSRLRILKKEYNMAKADHAKQIDEIEEAHIQEIEMMVGRQNAMQQKNAELEREGSRITSRLAEENNRIRTLEEEIARLKKENERHFCHIISRLDMENLFAELNASNDVLELLSTVIHPPTTDGSQKAVDTSVTLKDFWNNLMDREKDLVQNILEVSAEEVANAEYFQDWADRVDDFNDLKCSLSTRIYLSDMFSIILRQYFIQ